MEKSKSGIPGVTFSWKRALGISKVRSRFSRATGIPTTRSGLERKIGTKILGGLISLIFGRHI